MCVFLLRFYAPEDGSIDTFHRNMAAFFKPGVCFSQLMLFQVPSTGEEESLLVVQSYDDLSRKLWQLEGLPLSITAVQGAHPALRYTQVHSHVKLEKL